MAGPGELITTPGVTMESSRRAIVKEKD
ncbi:MAG: hypothetical protein QOI35_2854, partial [Cryptosporangiaceae bacterium]|nr:hypothetical protein [Cryptosporangiaceae bacterium]